MGFRKMEDTDRNALPPDELCRRKSGVCEEQDTLSADFLLSGPKSWLSPWVQNLVVELGCRMKAQIRYRHEDLSGGDVLFVLGYLRLLPKPARMKYRRCLVVHESALPRGRGWSPVAWQVLEGKSRIPVRMFEAVEELDAGPVCLEDEMVLQGHELLPEIRARQAEATLRLIRRFLGSDPWPAGTEQSGEPSYYARRTRKDDQLMPEWTLATCFEHMRVADNDLYPAWFVHKGHRYTLRIDKMEEETEHE